jgi:hypothetical protein
MWSCSCGRRAVTMVARRSLGEGSLFWHEKRQRWIGVVSQWYAANGKLRTTWVTEERRPRQRLSCARRSRLGMLICPPVVVTTRCGKLSSHGWTNLGAVGAVRRRAPPAPRPPARPTDSDGGAGGWTTIWCSPLDTGPSSTRRTYGVRSGPWRLRLAWRPPSGHLASCATVSSRCYRAQVCRSKRSRT